MDKGLRMFPLKYVLFIFIILDKFLICIVKTKFKKLWSYIYSNLDVFNAKQLNFNFYLIHKIMIKVLLSLNRDCFQIRSIQSTIQHEH